MQDKQEFEKKIRALYFNPRVDQKEFLVKTHIVDPDQV